MLEPISKQVYARDNWEIDLGRRELRSHGTPVALGHRAFEIIEVLARAEGRPVSKADLMQRIWPSVAIGDNSLQVHISAVRKVLGSDRNLLKTLHGRGYQLIGGWTTQQGGVKERPPIRRPHPRPEDRPSTNLPTIVDQLVGRTGAVQRVRDLLSAYRAVTLAGAGGIGKTVLALEAVRALVPDFADGTWLAELASLSDPALVPSTVAGALGLRLGGQVTSESLARAIGERHLLLVLDNCEHLIETVATLTETAIRLCPRTTIVATSREIMRIQGEAVYRVPALDVPAIEHETPEVILGHSAVELFVARAKALDTGFSPQPRDLRSIGEICRHLDGIPLAIEFAAARVALVGAEQVAASLRDRFALLASGRRTAISRHRTLRAVLDWSYRLLSKEEQHLLRHLAIFPAGFTFEAAQAVGGMGLGDLSIIEELSSVVSKSLCERVGSISPVRWRLLETVRAYGLEKLTENGEYSAAARRHAEYFRDLVSPITANSRGRLNHDDAARCGRELDNVRAALDWAFSPDGDAEIGAMLTAAFAPIWQMLSLVGECRDRVERMLVSPTSDIRLSMATELGLWLAYSESLTMTLAPFEQTRRIVQKEFDLIASLDDVELQAGILYGLWSIEYMSGNQVAALVSARQLTEVTSRGGDAMKFASDSILGTSLLRDGKLIEAQDRLENVVDLYVAPSHGHHAMLFRRDRQVLARVRLAHVFGLLGHTDRAYAEARTSFDLAEASGAGITVCWAVHDALCPIAFMMNDLAAAERAIGAMNDWAARMNATFWRMMASCWTGRLLIGRGESARGIELISQTLEACERTGWRMGYVEFLGCVVEGLTGLGRLDEAGVKLERAIELADQCGEVWYQPELMRLKGEFLLRKSTDLFAAEAESCFRAAIESARAQGALSWELRIALSLAQLHMAQGRGEEARQGLAPIYDRFTEGFNTPDMRAAQLLLNRPSP